jgi:hypothetical protein
VKGFKNCCISSADEGTDGDMLGSECGEDEGTDGDMLWNVGE